LLLGTRGQIDLSVAGGADYAVQRLHFLEADHAHAGRVELTETPALPP
jgi:hypothetical protein